MRDDTHLVLDPLHLLPQPHVMFLADPDIEVAAAAAVAAHAFAQKTSAREVRFAMGVMAMGSDEDGADSVPGEGRKHRNSRVPHLSPIRKKIEPTKTRSPRCFKFYTCFVGVLPHYPISLKRVKQSFLSASTRQRRMYFRPLPKVPLNKCGLEVRTTEPGAAGFDVGAKARQFAES
ncbi:hypothetical protein BDK51DRAFT_29132 [Blyttiomyces helicus]|uniref:Uncharacterized protein n=1 Tax=Blyttiomyces helicus TaxID=388810 RepID=A0A4P9W8K9_9FUNG|nr:hypothetical protein BDK51DRAFT_29132 [Blyttiomyces helicus]|eukprot:RKO88871.1 hypothetical protein BDK51DRAFT_29132 [Blyttiomyces helicus]